MDMSKFTSLYESILESVDVAKVRPQSIVVIDPQALSIKSISDEIIQRKGPSYFAQLQKIATDKIPLYVSALKTVRPVNNVHSSLPTSNDFQEADVVNYKPGLIGIWGAPITVPLSILKTVVDPGNIMQVPTPKHETEQGVSVGDNSYNQGKQHPNTVGKK